ncbi:BT1926 family outer membrane beta-barrel protein [Aureispira]|nr:BT1926 family outer membrane beta-barrel protein [Aureispira sp.]
MRNFLLFTLVILSTCLFAQKQEKGSLPLELEFSPLGNTPLKISGLKGRYFLSEKGALRLNLFLGGSSETTSTEITNNAGNDVTLKDVNSSFDFSIRPGYEFHLKGTERLSPYVGAEALFGINSTSVIDEDLDFITDEVNKTTTSTGTISLGLNLVSGCDYYFAKKFYVGVELGFGFTAALPPSTTVIDASNNTNTNVGSTSSFDWGPNYIATIRIGYCLK